MSNRIIVVGLVVLMAGVVGGAPPPGGATGQRPVSSAVAPSSEVTALEQAHRTGHRVEVPDRRDGKNSLFANPDGSLTLETSVFPTRVRRGAQWVPVDRTLRRDPSGFLTTGATTYDLHLATGGTQPLVTLGQGAQEVALSWPAPLPRPVVDGDSATYPGVLPDVDLVVRATDAGFAEVLVVKTRAAAANPALRRISFSVATRGVTLRSEPGGGFVGVDASAGTVFTGAQLLMWDSSGSDDGAAARVRGPAPSSRKAVIPTTVSATAVTLAPNWKSFTNASTTYPVYVDPSISVGKLTWAEVWKEIPNSTDINPSHEADVGFENDPCCLPASTVRAFWRMDTAKVNGKHVLSATFRTHEWWAWSCSARVVEVWWTGSITSSLTWNNQSWIQRQATANVAKRRGDAGCPEGDVEFNLTALTQKAANERWADMTLGMKASSETDPYTWKKFDNNPVLVITYNSVPSAPTGLTIDGKSCGSGTVLGTLTPTMRAQVSDPDAGTVLDVSMYWAPVGSAINETDKVVQTAVASGSTAIMAIPANRLSSGVAYYFQVRDTDRIDTSPLSAQCQFTVDITPPAQPAVSSPDYPADGNFHGGVGRTGSFTFSANGSTDVASYLYGWADPPTTAATPGATGGSVTITATPASQGINTLYVRSKDVAGNVSSTRQYVFYAGGPTAPAARWVDQPGSGTTLLDGSGNGHSATLTGSAAWVAGRDGVAAGAVGFTGGYAATTGPVAASNASFAVAAWVRLNSTANWASVLGEQGSVNTGMLLQYDKAANRWAMASPASDASGASITRAESAAAPAVGVWTHLTGTYDAGPGILSLYVNGVLAGTVSTRIGWSAGGPFAIGAEKLSGTLQNFFPGTVADVRVWDRLVYPAEIRAIATASSPVGTWTLDYDYSDSSGYAHDVTPNGTVNWGDGVNFLGGVALDGSGFLATSQPVVLTDQSFSVAAWVKLTATGGGNRTAVCQQGNRACAFYLQYNGSSNKWAFLARTSDVDNAPGEIVQSTSTPVLGAWTHLVGVYDASAQRVRIYVDGQLENEVAATAPTFNATGPLTIGQAKWNGVPVDSWPGELDDVRVFLGVLSDAQVLALYNQ